MLPIVHHPAYQAEIPADHRFPMGKFGRLAEVLVEEGIVAPGGFQVPELARPEWLRLAHAPAYVDAVIEGNMEPRVAREIGFPMNPSVARRAQAATGGTVLAARLALAHGIALNTAGGSHHARREQGAGFCVFNDVAVAASVLLAERAVSRVLVLDLDVHQGDGTADIFAGDDRVVTLSIHAERNYPVRKIPSSIDLGLADRLGDSGYLDVLDQILDRTIDAAGADIVFYNAGVDPHEDDRLGRLALSDAGLASRDYRVMEAVRSRGLPLVGVIGGGYDTDVDRLAKRHATLHRTARAFA
ncbi:histone deacetylase family protein [Chthonobacter albigriseus]|uniref:histone deacetylase family protein n=1 Tax=Chthonobacter albigriseus TaxID=1683161 RepID=UPI0015EFCBDB|nr:histone deacetylase [Chthonobacter albigriseus]